MKTIRCSYSLNYDYKPYFVNENGIFEKYVQSNFDYYDLHDSYDKNGNVVGWYRDNFRTVFETHKMDFQTSVIQIDFNFYLINSGRLITMDELYDTVKTLNNSNLGSFTMEYNFLTRSLCDYEKIHLMPFEVSATGHSRAIFRRSYNSFLNLDYKEYTKRLNNFKKHLKDNEIRYSEYLIDNADYIYNSNLELAARYYGLSKEDILKNKFNRQAILIEKLQNKITYKQKQQTR